MRKKDCIQEIINLFLQADKEKDYRIFILKYISTFYKNSKYEEAKLDFISYSNELLSSSIINNICDLQLKILVDIDKAFKAYVYLYRII